METLGDVQNSTDSRGIEIQKVGVKRVHLPLQILTQNGDYQMVIANVSLCADLTAQYRGTHMSRFMEILNRWSKKKLSSSEIKDILKEVCQKLEAERAQVSIDFKYFMEKASPVTSSTGFIDYDCLFYGLMEKEKFSFVLGVKVPIQLVCPCSLEISDYGAHNQRAEVNVKLEYYPQNFIWLEELVRTIESAGSSAVYPVIKREDEKFITESSFDNPKFVEDVLRDMVGCFRKDDRIRWFEVECDSFESIHNHNAFAYQKEYKPDKTREQDLVPITNFHFII